MASLGSDVEGPMSLKKKSKRKELPIVYAESSNIDRNLKKCISDDNNLSVTKKIKLNDGSANATRTVKRKVKVELDDNGKASTDITKSISEKKTDDEIGIEQLSYNDFVLMLKDLEKTETALQLFLDQSESDGDDIVSDFCQNTTDFSEVTSLLRDNSIHKPTIFHVLERVLIRIGRDLPEFTKLGAVVARELCSGHANSFKASLECNSNTRIKSALKLLVAMVTADTHSASNLAGCIREWSPCIEKLLSRKNIEDPQDVRTCAVLFIVSFFINGTMSIVTQVIECQDICAALFHSINTDDSCTIQLILSTIISKVMLNESLNKTTKLHLVRCVSWERLADLFYWQGKRSWNDNYLVKDTSPFEQTDEQTIVAEVTERFLLCLCTSSRQGIMFNDFTCGTSNVFKNKTILRALTCLRYKNNDRVRRIIVTTLQTCADVIRPYVWHLFSKTNQVSYAFLHQIFAAQAEQPRCMSFCQGVTVADLAERILVTILPQESVASNLRTQFIRSDTKTQREIVQLYVLFLSRLRLVVHAARNKLSELYVYSDRERDDLCHILIKCFRRAFPTIKNLVASLKSFNSLIQQSQSGDITSEWTDHTIQLQRFVALYKTELYPDTSLNLVYSCLTDVTKMLQSSLTGASGASGGHLLQLQMLNIVANDSSSHELVFQHEVGTQSSLISRLLDQLIDLSRDERLFSIAKHLLSKVCTVTGLFKNQPDEISVWLDPLRFLAEHPKRTDIIRFVARTLSGYILNPVAYQSAVNEHAMACSSAGKHAPFGDIKAEHALDFESILAMGEDEIRNEKRIVCLNEGRQSAATFDDEMAADVKQEPIDVKLEDGEEEIKESDADSVECSSPDEAGFSPLVMVALNGLLKMEVAYATVADYLDLVLLGLLHLQKDAVPFCSFLKKYVPELADCKWLPYLLSYLPDCGSVDFGDLEEDLKELAIKYKPLSLLMSVHLKLLAAYPLSDRKLSNLSREIRGFCRKLDDVSLTIFVKAIFLCLSKVVKGDKNMSVTSSRFYLSLLRFIHDEVSRSDIVHEGEGETKVETNAEGLNDANSFNGLMETDSPQVRAAKVVVLVLENVDVKENFNLSSLDPGSLQFAVTEEVVELLKIANLELVVEQSTIVQSYLSMVDRDMRRSAVTQAMLACFEMLLPFMKFDLLRKVVTLVFTSHKQVLIDGSGETKILSRFGHDVFIRLNRLTAGTADMLKICSSDLVNEIIDLAVTVNSDLVYKCLANLIKAEIYTGDISRAKFVKLLAKGGGPLIEICRMLIEQNGRLLKRYVSWLKSHGSDVEVKTQAPLLLATVKTLKAEGGDIDEHLTDLWRRVGDCDSPNVSTELAVMYVAHYPDEAQATRGSLLDRTATRPLTTREIRLLLGCLDREDLPGSPRVRADFVSACFKQLSHKSAWSGDEFSEANDACIERLVALIRQFDGDLDPDQYTQTWPNIVKYALRSRYDSVSVLRLFATVVPIVYGNQTKSRLTPTVASLYEMFVSHSLFVPTILGERSEKVKECLVDVLLTCVHLCPSVCHQKHLEVYLSAYAASLSTSDRKILRLMQLYENQGVEMSKLRPYLWGEMAQDYFSVRGDNSATTLHLPESHHVIDNLDPVKLNHSSVNFPLAHSLQMTPITDGDRSDDSVYDPCFILPLFSHLLASENLVQCHRFIEKGCLGYVMTSLSCRDPDLRALAYLCLTRFYQQAEGSKFYERQEILALIDLLRNSMSGENQRLPTIITAFVRRACLVFLDPGSFMYRPMSKLVMGKSSMSLEYFPDFYLLFFGANIDSARERAWILGVIHEGLRDVDDYAILARKRAFAIFETFYESSLTNRECRSLVLAILLRAVECSKLKVVRRGLLAWISSAVCTRETGDLEQLYMILVAIWRTYPRDNPRQPSDDFLSHLALVVHTELASPRSGVSQRTFGLLLDTYMSIVEYTRGSSKHAAVPLTANGAAVVVNNYLKVTNDAWNSTLINDVCSSFGINLARGSDKSRSYAEPIIDENSDVNDKIDDILDVDDVKVEKEAFGSNGLKGWSLNLCRFLMQWDAKVDIRANDPNGDAKLVLGSLVSNVVLRAFRLTGDVRDVGVGVKWIRGYVDVIPEPSIGRFRDDLVVGVIELLPSLWSSRRAERGDETSRTVALEEALELVRRLSPGGATPRGRGTTTPRDIIETVQAYFNT